MHFMAHAADLLSPITIMQMMQLQASRTIQYTNSIDVSNWDFIRQGTPPVTRCQVFALWWSSIKTPKFVIVIRQSLQIDPMAQPTEGDGRGARAPIRNEINFLTHNPAQLAAS